MQTISAASFILIAGARYVNPDRPYPASPPAEAPTDRCYCRRCSAEARDLALASSTFNDALAFGAFWRAAIFMQRVNSPVSPARGPPYSPRRIASSDKTPQNFATSNAFPIAAQLGRSLRPGDGHRLLRICAARGSFLQRCFQTTALYKNRPPLYRAA